MKAFLVDLLEEPQQLELLGDNRAALILHSGQGRGWRTRHLRLRSFALIEAVRNQEVFMYHRPGKYLLADALTKNLTAWMSLATFL